MIPANFRKMIGLTILTVQLLAPSLPIASPQIWVAVRMEVVFDSERRAIAINHVWEFDEFYSATVVGWVTRDGARSGLLSKWAAPEESLKSLGKRKFFTSARLGARRLAFRVPEGAQIEKDDKDIVKFRVTLPFEAPVTISESLVLDIYDPDHSVAFGLEIIDPVTMAGNHAGCSVKIIEPETFIAAYSKQPPTSAMITCR